MSKLLRDDVDRFFEFDIHIPSRTLFMGSECDERMAESMIKGMRLLENASIEPIKILMNNIGGDEYHGMGIYDAIACSSCYVTIIAYGHAMSMGSWILQAADRRIMAPNATLMIHYGTGGKYDHVKYVRAANKELERTIKIMEEVYLGRMREVDSKFPASKLRKMLDEEVYLDAKETVRLGLADGILGG